MLGNRCGLWKLALAVLPLGALTGCPQLLSDDFYARHGLGADDARPGAVPLLDASVDSESNTSAPAGAGGGTSTLPELDAGNAPDTGLEETTPLTEVQRALRSAMVHRYRFDSGATLLDSVGGANAVSVGASFSDGAAVLAGTGAGQYIDLPNGLLSGLRNATFEVWVIWDVDDPTKSTSEWQRIFDFGRNPSSVEGEQCPLDTNATDLFLTPRTDGTNLSGTLLRCESCPDTTAAAPSSLPIGVQVQIVGVVNDDANLLSLYQNGAFVSAVPLTASLSVITNCSSRPAPCDWNNWLGRSQHVEDPPFKGKILDFRVYSAALDATLIQASFAAGPDADW